MAQPIPPESAPQYIREGLQKQNAETLQAIAAYAEELANWKIEQTEKELEEQAVDEPNDVDAELPDDVPSKASVTIKEINDNRYYYWQWRDGDTIKSQYIKPVKPSS